MKIWKTIKIKRLSRKQLEKAGIKVSDYAGELLEKIEWKEEGEVNLVKITVGELFGDDKMHTTEEIYAKAQEKGLELCPAEVVPTLRLEYTDQPLEEWLYVGMEQIAASGGFPRVFGLERRGVGLWLCDGWAGPDDEWGPGRRFVFRLRKSDGNLDTSDPSALESRLEALEEDMRKIRKLLIL